MIVFDIVRMLRTVILMMPIIRVVVIIIVNCNYYFNSVQHT